MSLLSMIVKGGILMYVLMVISVIAIGIIIDKYWQLKAVKKANDKLKTSLSQQDKLDNMKSVIKMYGDQSPLGIMLDKLLNTNTTNWDLVNQSMESTATMQLHKLERGLGWLSTFAATAPLIGFLGTVIGMVRVFMNIHAQSQSGVDISMLAGGIWEALLTTIGGLVVGIVTIIFYNDLVQHLENIAKDMQDTAVEYLIKIDSNKGQ